MNSEIICDKGCNMKITRREYEINNCFSHLANRVSAQEKENEKLRHDLHEQLKHKLYDQKEQFKQILTCQQEEITKLNNEVSRQRSQLEHFESTMSYQQHQTERLMGKSKILLKFQVCRNVKIEESNILKVVDPLRFGFVKAEYPLEPTSGFFKVHILGIDNEYTAANSIGLNSENWLLPISISYRGNGSLHVNRMTFNDKPKWNVGDIIECGIKFRKNFMNNGNHSETVYISQNEKIIFQQSFTIPQDGVFPIIHLCGTDSSLRYYQ